MKHLFFLIAIVLTAGALNSCSEAKGNSESEFWVRGNCDMCKNTIEEALEAVPGVATVQYNLESNMATVSFDSAQTNPNSLESAVALAGYDTKTATADEAAYASLPKCCKKKEDL